MQARLRHAQATPRSNFPNLVGFLVILVSADKTSVVSADKTSVVSADKTSVVSLCQQTSPKTSPPTFPPQGRPRSGRPCVRNAQGMSWQTADLLSADTTDVLAADTTDVLLADTTRVLPADNPGLLWKDRKSCNPNLGVGTKNWAQFS